MVLRLTVLGDIHYSTAGAMDSSIVRQHAPLILSRTLDQLVRRQSPPDLVIQIGDIVDGTGQTPEEARADLAKAVSLFDAGGLRWTWIPGNHDVLACGGKTHLMPYLRRPRPYGELVFGDDVVLLLDSALRQAYGRIDAEQQAWLEERLEAHRDRRVFVFLHHVFDFSVEYEMYLENAEVIRPILCGSPAVKAIFMGHAHAHQIVSNNGVHEIVTGALTSWPLLFRDVEIDADSMRVRSVRVEAPAAVEAAAVAAHRNHPKPWRSEPYDQDFGGEFPLR